jgi:hypothetical protein
MKIDTPLILEIIERAKNSDFGLDDEPKHDMNIALDMYAQHDFSTLAQILVGAFYAKYDLISVFQAAMEIIAEREANTPKDN